MDIVWLRDDFRLDDQPALAAASRRPALFVYVHDETPENGRPPGGAAKWRLAQSLTAMESALSGRGARLDILLGTAEQTVLALAAATNPKRVLWTRRYEGAAIALDARVKSALRERGVEASSFNGRLLREPWELSKAGGHPSGSFSAFWRRHQALGALPAPLPAPKRLASAPWPPEAPARVAVGALRLTPTKPDWSGELALGERPGEAGARVALSGFLDGALGGYAEDRDQTSRETTSRSSRPTYASARSRRAASPPLPRAPPKPGRKSGGMWRSSSPNSAGATSRRRSSSPVPTSRRVPCGRNSSALPSAATNSGFRAWSRGETGYPIVDAGMRQLWRTGYMHNRVRMIAASFLVKHLLIDWRRGEEWFWDTLCDADPASNPMGWQWVAGSGADAAPYFRIFNPVLQAEKFDPDGSYVRRWVPELGQLEAPHVRAPWQAPAGGLARAGVVLGKTYPHPIVDHAAARARALAAFAEDSERRAG